MCLNTNTFKLCSCAGEKMPSNEIGWILERIDKNKAVRKIMGKPFFPPRDAVVETLSSTLTQQLNIRNCFDFDYRPQKHDRLALRVPETADSWIYFQFNGKKWIEDSSTKFSTWRQKLIPYQEGKVEC